jgi:hypothetical protein
MKFNSIKQQFFSSKNNLIIHNRYFLYSLLILSLANLYYLAISEDYISVAIFIIIGFLTTFFSKNMIIILFFSLIFTNILRYGPYSTQEGLDNINNDDEEDTEETNDEEKEVVKDKSTKKISNKKNTKQKVSNTEEYSNSKDKKSVEGVVDKKLLEGAVDKKTKKSNKENLVGSELNKDEINASDVINKIKQVVQVLQS